MAKMDDFMAGKLDPNDPWVAYGRQQGWLPERSSFEAAQPVAQAPERKRSWGGKPVDTRTFQQYDPSNPVAQRQVGSSNVGILIPNNPYQKEAEKHVLETVAGYMDDPTNFMLPGAGAIAGTFAGVKAKNAPLGLLKKAEQMAAEGIPDKQIWSETGWTKGFPDKQWRFEIPDNEMSLKNLPINQTWEEFSKAKEVEKYGRRGAEPTQMNQKEFKEYKNFRSKLHDEYNKSNAFRRPLTDLMEHEQVYAAYPDIPKKVSATWGGHGDMTGSYASNNIGFGDVSRPESTRKLMAHELQHAVEEREGFARGGSPEQFMDKLGFDKWYALQQDFIKSYNDAAILRRYMDKNNVGVAEAKSLFRRELGHEPHETAGYTAKQMTFKEISNEIDAVAKKIEEQKRVVEKDPYEQYRSLAGEAEARLTANRMNLTPEQRRAQYPVSEFDVPVEKQIVRGVPGAVEQAYAKMRDPKSKAMLERQYPELKGD